MRFPPRAAAILRGLPSANALHCGLRRRKGRIFPAFEPPAAENYAASRSLAPARSRISRGMRLAPEARAAPSTKSRSGAPDGLVSLPAAAFCSGGRHRKSAPALLAKADAPLGMGNETKMRAAAHTSSPWRPAFVGSHAPDCFSRFPDLRIADWPRLLVRCAHNGRMQPLSPLTVTGSFRTRT